jgi:predicted nucleic acid-binding protein
VDDLWITNASPLLYLAHVNHLHLMERLAHQIIVPDGVYAEIMDGPLGDPAVTALTNGWRTRQNEGLRPSSISQYGIGPGESAVLTIALTQPNGIAVLDDSEAREIASRLGIRMIGTLAILMRSKSNAVRLTM